jgi:hypothetical protein
MMAMTGDRRARALSSLYGLALGDAPGSQFFVPYALRAAACEPLPDWAGTGRDMADRDPAGRS